MNATYIIEFLSPHSSLGTSHETTHKESRIVAICSSQKDMRDALEKMYQSYINEHDYKEMEIVSKLVKKQCILSYARAVHEIAWIVYKLPETSGHFITTEGLTPESIWTIEEE
ncbi:uncharacterized protein KRP23_1896 [Phytophthora ramorum]|uniref:uncharacterized protein n=1 Tax=Phytophthora ramorum TaxID=164328 RepID=UPI0030B33405|nr:hypothetical protein KRP23_1896 [Phytophthora ramorum]